MLIIENNYGRFLLSDIVSPICNAFPGRVIEMRDLPGVVGVATNNKVKFDAAAQTIRLLNSHAFSICDKFVTSFRHEKCTAAESEKILLQWLRDQLLEYSDLRKVTDDPMKGEGKMILTGKTAPGRRDDLAIALQLVVHHSLIFKARYDPFGQLMSGYAQK